MIDHHKRCPNFNHKFLIKSVKNTDWTITHNLINHWISRAWNAQTFAKIKTYTIYDCGLEWQKVKYVQVSGCNSTKICNAFFNISLWRQALLLHVVCGISIYIHFFQNRKMKFQYCDRLMSWLQFELCIGFFSIRSHIACLPYFVIQFK